MARTKNSDKKPLLLAAFKEFLAKADKGIVIKLMEEDFCLDVYKNSANKAYRNKKGELLTVLKEVTIPITAEQISDNLSETKNNVVRYYKQNDDILSFDKKSYVLSNNLYPGIDSDLDSVIQYISPYISEPLKTQVQGLIAGQKKDKSDSKVIEEDKNIVEINETMITDKPIEFNLKDFKSNTPYAERYVKSLLAKPFVILAGNSGTGKTRIAKNFATWLEKTIDEESKQTNKLIVPVGADWTDNTKVLGFYNPIKETYESTKILDFILLADEYPEIPFFLILDEMNLSHVERYFADFLSAMESDEPIILYKKPDGSKSTMRETLRIPSNLFITGTVNIDETTYMFSPKVLDRANVIEFKPTKNEVLNTNVLDTSTVNLPAAEKGMAEGFVILADSVRKLERGVDTNGAATIDKVLSDFYDELEKFGFEFAFRTVKEITRYICASISLDQDYNLQKILDEQIVQKILPKLHGNKRQLGKLLPALIQLCKSYGVEKDNFDEEDYRYYKFAENDEERGVYLFGLSLNKISQMQLKLEMNQFTSFI